MSALAFGYLFIALAVSILVAYAAGKIWYIIPIFILLIGVYVLFLGTRPHQAVRGSPSAGVYLLSWGTVLVLVGLEIVLNDLFPNNLVLLIAVFLIVVGLMGVVTYIVSPKRFRA